MVLATKLGFPTVHVSMSDRSGQNFRENFRETTCGLK
jgi:hypothetical protein